MLKIEDLSFTIGNKRILSNISFCVSSGEHLVILGANGAGKSTLLKLISGDLSGYLGNINLNDKELRTYKTQDLARTRAVMPQEVQLDFPFKAAEVVAMGHAPHPPAHRSNSITDACLAKMDVLHLANRVYPSMSGGEKQRVQLARIFCQIEEREHSPKNRFLFLDECTSALDPAHQHQVFDQVSQIKSQQSLGVVSIMHDLNLAAHYADKVLILKHGDFLALGTPEETLTPDNLQKAYEISTQVMNHPCTQRPLIINLGL